MCKLCKMHVDDLPEQYMIAERSVDGQSYYAASICQQYYPTWVHRLFRSQKTRTVYLHPVYCTKYGVEVAVVGDPAYWTDNREYIKAQINGSMIIAERKHEWYNTPKDKDAVDCKNYNGNTKFTKYP